MGHPVVLHFFIKNCFPFNRSGNSLC